MSSSVLACCCSRSAASLPVNSSRYSTLTGDASHWGFCTRPAVKLCYSTLTVDASKKNESMRSVEGFCMRRLWEACRESRKASQCVGLFGKTQILQGEPLSSPGPFTLTAMISGPTRPPTMYFDSARTMVRDLGPPGDAAHRPHAALWACSARGRVSITLAASESSLDVIAAFPTCPVSTSLREPY